MTIYTMEIQGSDITREIWQALAPAEMIEDEGSPDEVARWVAHHQTLAEDGVWRVRVWNGKDADTSAEPAAEYERPESEVVNEMLSELSSVVARRDRLVEELDAQRDELIRDLMQTDVSRDRLAAVAGFKGPARLYQVRDGRR